ncbi:YheU family protein [Methylococcus capsulatus]|jgi:uncharacterized protein YheU (UPF0270 family)|uniref:YheU family protein n=1 Tax=Methylococcus capsulatus TaxID=414 RepID=A0AA35UR41_METCP|nr:YheU family protein [Methylococcus capsulatus]QXP89608.1 YheU family protein [Methylococcus capsulatus]CAI8817606.1 conserved protein of unknown function [Methylococcus capsulatus]
MNIPYDRLSPEALRNLLIDIVTRDGTDYSAEEIPLETKIAQAMQVLEEKRAVLVYSERDGTVTLSPV